MANVPKWKTLAASTASAPASTAGGKCSAAPAPPLAITGTVTSRRTARIRSRSKPARVPSASMALSRISPAPSSQARLAQAIASRPADLRPPWVVTSKPESVPGARRASTESTSTWLPNRSAISATSSGRWMAAVLTATLSAPARSRVSTSSVLDTPPPTVSGMKTCSAVRLTTSRVVARPSWEAEMSRKVSSSAPWASYRAASSTGSPASRSSRKFTPLTTRPLSTSRHGITRIARVMGGSAPAPR